MRLINAIKNVPGLNTGMLSASMNSAGDVSMSSNYLVILDGVPIPSDGNILLSILFR